MAKNLTRAEADALCRAAAQTLPRAPNDLLAVFVPGSVRNPLNGSHGHWSKRARWAKTWRERTVNVVAIGLGHWPSEEASRMPKRVTFFARTHNRMDDDNLRAALKPVRDALRDMRVIHDDDPASGHEFVYEQVIDRARRGVEIRVRVR